MQHKRLDLHIFIILMSINIVLIAAHLLFHGIELSVVSFEFIATLIRRFSMDAEASITAWFASSLLLAISAAFGAAYYMANADEKKYWGVLSCVFLYLSIDEAAEIHELLIDPMQSLFGISSGPLFFAWVIPVGCVIVLLAAFLFKFIWNLPVRYRNQLFLAAMLFITGAMGVEMISGYYWESVDFTYDMMYRVLNAFEEGLENTGSILALSATIGYLNRKYSSS